MNLFRDIFREVFLEKINLVQLGIVFLTKHILFLILGKTLDEAIALSCLLLLTALKRRFISLAGWAAKKKKAAILLICTR